MEFKETEESISLHGLGFIQVKLQGNQRLHVWHPELPRRKCFRHSQIHDHRFGFVSRVLIGTQRNIIYTVSSNLDHGPATYVAYKHEGARTKFGNRPWISDYNLSVQPLTVENIQAGQSYDMKPYIYHATMPEGKVATVMTKTMENNTRGAHSLCEIGIVPDVDFNRKQWPDHLLWAIVRDVLSGDK